MKNTYKKLRFKLFKFFNFETQSPNFSAPKLPIPSELLLFNI